MKPSTSLAVHADGLKARGGCHVSVVVTACGEHATAASSLAESSAAGASRCVEPASTPASTGAGETLSLDEHANRIAFAETTAATEIEKDEIRAC